MRLRDVLLRTFLFPVWLPGPPKVEQWTCPACGRDVERISPAWKGIWFTALPDELMNLCARAHGTHDRRGLPLPVDDSLDGVEDWVPIVAIEAAAQPADPPASFVALLPPSGVAFVLDTGDGRFYELRRLRELSPSDLVGPRAASLPAERIGRVAVSDVVFAEDLRAVRVIAELGLAVGDAPTGDAFEGGERPTLV